jgi:hypothetical protein
MDTYIPYYTPDGVVDVFVGTPGEFADLAVANNWTAITSMGTDSTTTDVNVGPTTTDVNVGPTSAQQLDPQLRAVRVQCRP